MVKGCPYLLLMMELFQFIPAKDQAQSVPEGSEQTELYKVVGTGAAQDRSLRKEGGDRGMNENP